MYRVLVVVVVALGCGGKAQQPSVGSAAEPAAAVARPTGNLVWVKPALAPPGDDPLPPPPSPDPMQRDRLMVLDVAAKASIDIGEPGEHGRVTRTAAGDGAYLVGLHAIRMIHKVASGWKTDDTSLGQGFSVAPDGSSVLRLGAGGLCVAAPGAADCSAKLALPFEAWDPSDTAYTSGNRLVVWDAEGKQDGAAVAMGMKLQVAVADLTTQTASRLDVPAIGFLATVSPDGRLAWIENQHDELVLAVAPLDQLAAKKTFDLGPARAQSDAQCTFAGERILCVVRPAFALVSLSLRDGSIVPLERGLVVPGAVFPSPDGRWVAYLRTSETLEDSKWLMTPVDRAASEPLPIDGGARILTWLR